LHDFNLDKLGQILEDQIVTLGTSIDGAVRRISRAYDARGLVSSITSHDDPTVGAGSVVNQVVNEYDAFGQQTADIQSHDGAADGSTPRVSYTYADGSANTTRRTSVTYPSGKVINISYGAAGSIDDRLDRTAETQIAGEGQPLATFQWAGAGRLLRLGLPQPGLELSYHKPADEPVGDSGDPYSGYDRFGRTVDMRWNKLLSGESVQSVDRIQYGYDRASRRLWRQDLAAPASAKQDKFYQYDGLGQVRNANQGNLNINRTAIAAVPVEAEAFAYDPIGNWQNYQRDEDGFPVLEQPRQNNQDNQITSLNNIAAGISYDANGNMTATLPDKDGDWSKGYTMLWDAWNRLVQVNNAQTSAEVARYSYDGTTRRTQSLIADPSSPIIRHYFYNNQWKCVEERLDASTTSDRHYFWGMRPGHRDELLRRDHDNTSHYCLMDYFDPIAITDSDGVVQERFNYSAYGLVHFQEADFTPKSDSEFNWTFLFHGQFRDIETGWENYGYRYYQPELGQWLSTDPMMEFGGQNFYIMVGNAPMNAVDWLGLLELQLSVDIKGATASKGIEGIAWYQTSNLRPGREGQTDVNRQTGEPNCKCVDKATNLWNGSIKIKLQFEVWISANSNNKKGTYGHEQKHIQNIINEAAKIQEEINRIKIGVGAVGEQLCQSTLKSMAADFMQQIQGFIARESAHQTENSPGASESIPPKGGNFPPNPTKPPVGAAPNRFP